MSKSGTDLFVIEEKVDAKSFNFLVSAIVKSSKSGFDYLKFRESINALGKMNMDTEMAVKSAFTTASTMGFTKDKIITSASDYIQILDSEKAEFNKALDKQIKDRIETKKTEGVKHVEKIKIYQDQIKKLEEEIQSLETKIQSIQGEVEEAETRIKDSSERFENAYQSISAQISKDIEIYNQIL